MPFEGPEDLWNELRRVSPHHLGGISYARIAETGLQWPCPDESHPGTPLLHEGSFPLGKARLALVDYRPPAEQPDADYPLLLTTGRRLSTYHTNTQTGRVRGFERLVGRELLEMSPIDADELDLADGELVVLESRRGAVRVHVQRTERSPRGTVFTSFAFGTTTPVNVLTSTAVDPTTKTPEFKACAVRVRKVAPAPGR
jgi:formate dehydrogenase major subunit